MPDAVRREGVVPRYALLYFVDPEEARQTRVERHNLDPEIVREITSHLEGPQRVILNPSEILDPQRIWHLFQDNFTDDCLYRIRTMGDSLLLPPNDWSNEERRIDYDLWLLCVNLRDFGMDFAGARIRGSRHRWVDRRVSVLISEAQNFDQEVEAEFNR
ncbi:hypothetical protein EPUL_006007 [Erysiphe pulchra]|uniref:Uncharacterized protein n=1 Tax=Erysiphe pulchra TaxID=225359 RepID=A0A2S4PL57_9PEZI|nr:hypothetical protein EPUL_006007 [Erysiphe pulchra]